MLHLSSTPNPPLPNRQLLPPVIKTFQPTYLTLQKPMLENRGSGEKIA